MGQLIRPPRGLFFCSGSGQGNLTILGVQGEGEYFTYAFGLDDYFEYAIENKAVNLAETGVGTITQTTPSLGVFSRVVDKSTDGNTAINVPDGVLFNLLFKTSDGRGLSVDPKTGLLTNTEAVVQTVNVPTFETLRTQAIPVIASAGLVVYNVMYGATVGDGRGGLFEWRPASLAAFQDPNVDVTVNVIKSANATNGRYHRLSNCLTVPELADASRPLATVSRDDTTLGLVSQRQMNTLAVGLTAPTAGHKKVIPEMEVASFQGSFATIATLLALASTKWRDGDWVEVRGKTVDGDLRVPLKLHWVFNDTDTTSTVLGVSKWRPDDISGGAAGRWVADTPSKAIKFPDSDATPDVSGSDEFYCADIVPTAGYTDFLKFRDNASIIIRPGAQTARFVHSSTYQMPQSRDFYLAPGDAPIWAIKTNGVVRFMAAFRGGVVVAGTLADTAIPTVVPYHRYQLYNRTYSGLVGLAAGEWVEFVAPASSLTTLSHGVDVSGTPNAVPFSFDGNNDLIIGSTERSVFRVSRVGSNLFVAGGGVVGPTAATSGNFATFNGASGKIIADSGLSPTRVAFSIPAAGVGGTADAIALTLTSGPALADGLTLGFLPDAANTGGVTIDYNTGGAVELLDGAGAALSASSLTTTAPVLIRYDATAAKWRLVSGGGGLADLANTSDAAKGDALVGVKPVETGGVASTLHIWIQNRGVAAGEYGATSGQGAGDQTALLQLAIDAAQSRKTYVDFLGRDWECSGTLIVPSRAILVRGSLFAIGADNQILLQAVGSSGTTYTLSVVPTKGATTLTFTNAAGIAVGDRLFIRSDDNFTIAESGKKGEWVTVKSIAGNVVTLAGRLKFTYATNYLVHKPVLIEDVVLEDLRLFGKALSGSQAQAGLLAQYGRNINLRYVRAERFGYIAFDIRTILGGEISDCEASRGNPPAGAYGAGVTSGCDGIGVKGGLYEDLRHPVVLGGTYFTDHNITISNVKTRACSDGIDSHSNVWGLTVEGCNLECYTSETGQPGDGIVAQGCNVKIANNIIRGWKRAAILAQPSTQSGEGEDSWQITGNQCLDPLGTTGLSGITFSQEKRTTPVRNPVISHNTINMISGSDGIGIHMHNAAGGGVGRAIRQPVFEGNNVWARDEALYIQSDGNYIIDQGSITGGSYLSATTTKGVVRFKATTAGFVAYMTCTGLTVQGGGGSSTGFLGENTPDRVVATKCRVSIVGTTSSGITADELFTT